MSMTRADERRVFLLAVGLLVLVVWAARSVLTPFLVSGFLGYAFAPLVASAERGSRWPRPAIVGLAYLAIVAAIAVLGWVLAGRLGREIAELSNAGPDLIANALRQLIGEGVTIGGAAIPVADLSAAIHSAIDGLVGSPKGAIELAGVVVDVGLQAVLVVIVTFYLLVDAPRIRAWSIDLVPASDRRRATELLDRIHAVLGTWLRGQLLLIGLVAVVAYLFLGPILHVPYALAIGVLTGVLEVIPLVGPLIAAVIAMAAALVAGGPGTAIAVGVGYLVIRQVEDQLVMPVVIGRAVHLHPVVTIFAVLAGLSIYGVVGGLLAVPIAAAVNVIFTDLYRSADETSPHPAARPGGAEEPPGDGTAGRGASAGGPRAPG